MLDFNALTREDLKTIERKIGVNHYTVYNWLVRRKGKTPEHVKNLVIYALLTLSEDETLTEALDKLGCK